MKIRGIMLPGIILLVLAFTIGIGTAQSDNQASKVVKDDIEPYEGSIGPENALYGLKIAFEGLDEAFTFNASEKLGKQIAHARQRLAEAKAELIKNNTKAAGIALEQYMAKSEEANESVSRFSGSNSGLLHAQEMIKKHQQILYNLSVSHPDNTGLARAYDNSLKLEEKFNKRVAERGEREELEEEVKVKAEIIDSATRVKVSVKFISNSTENTTLAQEIRNKLNLSRGTISDLLELEEEKEESVPTPAVTVTGTPTATLTATATPSEELKEKLEAKVEIEKDISKVKVEFKFLFNTTNRTEIVEGIYQELSTLKTSDILNALEIKVQQEQNEIKVKDKKTENKKAQKGKGE